MAIFVQIHFTPEAVAQIQKTLPDFSGSQVFNNAEYVEFTGQGVQVTCPCTEADKGKFIRNEVDYFYPMHQIARIKQAEMVDIDPFDIDPDNLPC